MPWFGDHSPTGIVGTIEPLWNIFDLTPEGRGDDWDEQLEYDR